MRCYNSDLNLWEEPLLEMSLSWSRAGRITPSKQFSRWAGSFLSHDLLLGPTGRSEGWEAKESPEEEALRDRKEGECLHAFLLGGWLEGWVPHSWKPFHWQSLEQQPGVGSWTGRLASSSLIQQGLTLSVSSYHDTYNFFSQLPRTPNQFYRAYEVRRANCLKNGQFKSSETTTWRSSCRANLHKQCFIRSEGPWSALRMGELYWILI